VVQWVYERRERPSRTTPRQFVQRDPRADDQLITHYERPPIEDPGPPRDVWGGSS
jgi:hypothetical protein